MGASRIGDGFKLKQHGQLIGVAAATQLPSLAGCHWIKFKAKKTNAGVFCVAQDAAITLPDGGASNVTAGWELAAGQETDWLPVGGNLNTWYYYATDNTNHAQYMVL